MELKQFIGKESAVFFRLLIVPYGIETDLTRIRALQAKLLIVPYGIETPRKV